MSKQEKPSVNIQMIGKEAPLDMEACIDIRSGEIPEADWSAELVQTRERLPELMLSDLVEVA